MISVEEALQLIYKHVEPLNSNSKSEDLEKSHNRILDGDLYSKYDLPPFRASIKDGYAVLANDGKGKRRVLSGIKAGDTVSNIVKIFYILYFKVFIIYQCYKFIGHYN